MLIPMKKALPAILAVLALMYGAACANLAVVPIAASESGTAPRSEPSTPEPTPTPTEAPTPSPSPSPSPTATPSPTPEPSPTPTPKPDDGLPYYLYFEKGSNTLTVYGKDESGEYTVVLHTFLCAAGKTATRTPTKKFQLTSKRDRWHTFKSGDGHVYAQYATNFYRSLYIHSSLYSAKEIDRLDPYFYKQIGKNVTAGCLRTTAYAAWWIYTNCPDGTTLEIVNGSPKGTKAEQPPEPIPGEKKYRYYDPSDPERPGYTEPPS